MKEYIKYIARHWNQSVLEISEGYKKDAVYGFSDPRMHLKEREEFLKLTKASAERPREDFESLHQTIDDYVIQHGCIPCCCVLQLQAMKIYWCWIAC